MSADAQDVRWIRSGLDRLRREPTPRGPGKSRALREMAHTLVAAVLPERRAALLVALFEVYAAENDGVVFELMMLVEALYAGLPPQLSRCDACEILAATRHSCGHGGVEEPIALAQAAYRSHPYDADFFSALRTYQGRLKGITSAEATRARGTIALLLWQDGSEPLHPSSCLSRPVRDGFVALTGDERDGWEGLLRHVDRTARRRPDKKWSRAARPALDALGVDAFARRLGSWWPRPQSDKKVAISTGGRHVLKTLIWYVAMAETKAFDAILPCLIDMPYAKPKAAVHLIYAVGHWLEGRPSEFAAPHRDRLRQKWPTAGARVRG